MGAQLDLVEVLWRLLSGEAGKSTGRRAPQGQELSLL